MFGDSVPFMWGRVFLFFWNGGKGECPEALFSERNFRLKKLFMFCVWVVVGVARGANSHPCEVAPCRPVRGATALGTSAEHKGF